MTVGIFTNADRDLKTEIRREIGMLFQGGALFDSKKRGRKHHVSFGCF